jgi:hypothetical protein
MTMQQICPHCHIGSPRIVRGTWAGMIGAMLITVPEIRVQVCDACGDVDYDPAVLERVEALLQASWGAAQKNRQKIARVTWLPGMSRYQTSNMV